MEWVTSTPLIINFSMKSGFKRVVRQFNVVVLPAPFGTSKATISPSVIVIEKSFTALTALNDFLRFFKT